MEITNLRSGIEKIEQLTRDTETKIIEVNGEKYSTRQMYKVEKPYYGPMRIALNTLDSLVDIVKVELTKAQLPLFVRVTSPTKVDVFTTYKDKEEKCKRDYIYECTAELPDIITDRFIEYESFIIALMSKFVENEDSLYTLNLLSNVTDSNSVTSSDNGLSQSVQAKKGIVMIDNVLIKPIVNLIPFRTFLEVEQPASNFLLRLKEGGGVAIFEADGGAWKLEAKRKTQEYLQLKFKDDIENGSVIVIA